MIGLVGRLKSWVTGEDLDDDMYGIDHTFEPVEKDFSSPSRSSHHAMPMMEEDDMVDHSSMNSRRNNKKLKVVDHPSGMTAHVMVIEPKAFEEALDIVEHLRARKSVILNLHLLDTSQSQRVVDFLSGATHAIDGHQQRIGDGVFIFTPSNVDITTDKVLSSGFSTEGYWGNAPNTRY